MTEDIGAFVPGPRIHIEWRRGGPLAGIQRQSGCDERVNQDEKARLDFGMIVAIYALCNA